MLNSWTGILAAAALMVLVMVLLGGCSQTSQYAAVNQAVIADRAAVQSADALLVAKTITPANAKTVLDSAVEVRVSLAAWESSVLANNSAAVTTTSNAASTELQALLATQAQLPAGRNPELGRKRLTLKPVTGNLVTGNRKISPAAVVAIIQLAADFTPVVTTWINSAFNQNPVTADTVTETFAALDADISKLRADIAAAGG